MADILVLGATGYCGRLIARYFLEHPERASFTLALAARSRAKLEASGLKLDAETRFFEVDLGDFDALEAAVKQVKVVVNAVGPYWGTGTPVVRACARNGVHYVDITGETAWIYTIIHQYDHLASKTHALIIPSCGFDSIPSDAAAFLANRTLKRARGIGAGLALSSSAVEVQSGVAGGTLATAISAIEEVPPNLRGLAFRAWSLSPVVGRIIKRHRLLYTLPSPSPALPASYGSFHFMAPINRAIVERTWGLHELAAGYAQGPKALTYGPQFVYEEFLSTRSAISGFLLTFAFVFVSRCLSAFKPLRWIFQRVGTQPGQGPPEDNHTKGFFRYTNVSVSDETPPTYIKTVVGGTGSGGTWLTAIMCAESALAILLQKAELPALAQEGGVLTPMSGLGGIVLERLEKTGLFEFNSEIMDGEAETRKNR